MDKTINPGLLFQRMYFESGYSELLGISEWQEELKQAFEKRHKGKKSFKPPQPDFSPAKALLDADESTSLKAHFSLRNHYLFNFSYPKVKVSVPKCKMESIKLQTTYPGLLVGVGYNHQVSNTEAINAGFSFDHTTGLPLLPGSSVKGTLRSAFPGEDLHRQAEQIREIGKITNDEALTENEKAKLSAKAARLAEWYATSAAAKAKTIRKLLEASGVRALFPVGKTIEGQQAINPTPLPQKAPEDGAHGSVLPSEKTEPYPDDFLARLEQELFASKVPDPRPNAKPGAVVNLPIPARVIFHGGEIVAANGPVLGPDNVTPHLSRRNNEGLDEDQIVPDRYVEPIPISLLKVMPGVTFAFRFTLPDHYDLLLMEELYRVKPTLAPAEARALFSGLLRAYGVGAKSRVGYGRLVLPASAAEREDSETTNNEFFPPYAKFGTPDFKVPPPERAEGQPAANAAKPEHEPAVSPKETSSADPMATTPREDHHNNQEDSTLRTIRLADDPEKLNEEEGPALVKIEESLEVKLIFYKSGKATFDVPGQTDNYVRSKKMLDESVESSKKGYTITARVLTRNDKTKNVEELIFDWTSWKAPN